MGMLILVVDGQGGGVGKALIEQLKAMYCPAEILAVGTNTAATAAMKKAGADFCATGENAVVYNSTHADIIAGSIGIIAANTMLGELSPAMATAISGSRAVKILIPTNKCNLMVCGVVDEPMPERITKAAQLILQYTKKQSGNCD